MTAFWIVAGLGVAAALAIVLRPLFAWRHARTDVSRTASNASIYREQIAELEADVQRGAIGREEFNRASSDIERRVVAEHAADAAAFTPNINKKIKTATILVAAFVPLFAGSLYWKLGEPRALDPRAATQITPQQVEAMVTQLSAHLQSSPEDAQGWAMLGRALFVLGRHEPATRALARALQLDPQNRELLGELLQGLALAGQDKFQQADYAGAVAYWERILRFAPPGSELSKTVNGSIAEARELATKKGRPIVVASVKGTVTLDAKLKGKAAPADTVFVIARPAAGGRVPLAVARVTVAELPYEFLLDDSMAMAPGATISSQKSVVIVARVSKSGNALPQKGDLEGSSKAVAPGAAGVKVAISRIVP
ncbi:MAG TPA: c-type cytochrome biogenesis protein CcmI [Burkholderiales bacterium]|jgi:cytochrome c-type biogenesis protein CcmH|nr:c-type cytochrome biogenesis protein CcmI [Burkholderiales bacterium]